MKIATIKINGQTASGRTRSRIKQHGPEFEIREPNIKNSSKTDEILLFSVKTQWCGWIPKKEIFISFMTHRSDCEQV